MQLATFNAVCDVELGDKVRFASKIITEITEIRTVHYLKDQRVEFEFELAVMPGLWSKRGDFVYPVVDEAPVTPYTHWDAGEFRKQCERL